MFEHNPVSQAASRMDMNDPELSEQARASAKFDSEHQRIELSPRIVDRINAEKDINVLDRWISAPGQMPVLDELIQEEVKRLVPQNVGDPVSRLEAEKAALPKARSSILAYSAESSIQGVSKNRANQIFDKLQADVVKAVRSANTPLEVYKAANIEMDEERIKRVDSFSKLDATHVMSNTLDANGYRLDVMGLNRENGIFDLYDTTRDVLAANIEARLIQLDPDQFKARLENYREAKNVKGETIWAMLRRRFRPQNS